MTDFVQTLLGEGAFLRHALWIALLSSVALGAVGTFVVIKRISYLAGAIAHCALGGIGFALYAKGVWGWGWMEPWIGALLAGVFSGVGLSVLTRRARERPDSVIGAFWCLGMAVGIIFIAATPGYLDPMQYLFGNVLMVSAEHLKVALVLTVVLLALLVFFWRPLYALCLDEEFARLRGVPTGWFHMLLMVMVALSVVMLVQVVGIVLVIAVLTLPAAMAGQVRCRLFPMMGMAMGLGALLQGVGLIVSYYADMPSGACMVLFCSLAYFGLTSWRQWRSG